MKRSIVTAALLAGALLFGQGCVGRLVSEGMEKGLGPTGLVLPMEPRWSQGDPQYLAMYKNFEIGAMQNEFADTPAVFTEYFPGKLRDQMLSKGLPMGRSGKTLLIEVDILAYQPVSSYHKALGPVEEVVARVTLKDKNSGRVVGTAICIGRTYQSVGLGPKWKAWGLARAIVDKWIDESYPKEGRHEREEQAAPSEE
jgi:hypothetical protein